MCEDLTGAEPDRRLCTRSWSGPGFGLFVRVYFRSDGRDPQLRLDVNRDG